jgi:transcription regulator GlnR-like protein
LLDAGSYDAVFVDARWDLAGSRSLCRLVGSTGLDVPVVVVISEGALVALSAEWGCDEFLLPRPCPPERVPSRQVAMEVGCGSRLAWSRSP